MKTKLLRKSRHIVTLMERNGLFYINTGSYIDPVGKQKMEALDYYRFWVFETAKRIFGFKPKKIYFK
jgi:hypothetical protein